MASLPRSSSCKSTSKIIPANYTRSSGAGDGFYQKALVRRPAHQTRSSGVSTFLRSLISIFTIPACRWLHMPTHLTVPPSLGRKVTGTLFGNRRGAVSFAVQFDPRSPPAFVVELAVSTAALVKEMSAGMMRIALECEKPPTESRPRRSASRLFGEPVWKMYCNGRQCGHAQMRECNE